MTGITDSIKFSLGLALLAASATMQPMMAQGAEDLRLSVGKSIVIDYPSDVRQISTSNPEIVDANPVTTREILVHGRGLGNATMIVWAKSGERTFYNISVDTNLEPLRRLLKQTFPNETVTVQSSRDSISLIGQVSSAAAAERIVALAAPFGKTIVNNLMVALPPADKQIMLKVKFAELDRTKSLQYGVNLTSTGATNTLGSISTGQFSATKPTTLGGNGNSSFTISDALNIFAFRPDLNLSAFIKALQGEAILQILAEPNLVTTSGKEASFLVGGEFPVPILQGGANSGSVTVSFREFGIRLRFLPVLTDNKTVKMHLMHEVTTIDLANAVQVAGFTIPALSSRRAETDIELGIGQSFVVAGLIDNRETENIAKIPGLSNLPILGQLFKSKDMKAQRTELVLIVTPEITQALAPGEKAPTPYLPKDFLVPITPPPTKQASAAPPAATTESAEKTSSSRHWYGLRRSTN